MSNEGLSVCAHVALVHVCACMSTCVRMHKYTQTHMGMAYACEELRMMLDVVLNHCPLYKLSQGLSHELRVHQLN